MRVAQTRYPKVFNNSLCLICCRLFFKGDRRLDLFCFTKLLTVWHKCPSKASLLRRIWVLKENTTWNLDRLAIQLASMYGRSFFLKLLVHGTGLLSLKLRHWLYVYQIFLTFTVHPFHIILLKGPAEYWNRNWHDKYWRKSWTLSTWG